MTALKKNSAALRQLESVLDSYAGSYRELTRARDFAAYLAAPPGRADEELLTEPVLALILERVLGFPRDRYFPQYGKGGLKPDLTPHDLIAHPFVLDAKSSTEVLGTHEPQIRRYITQRSLDLGVLFNLHELRVYRAGEKGHDRTLSFRLLPVWQAARGEAMPGPEVEAFERFCARFAYREVDDTAKIAHVRKQRPWHTRIEAGEPLTVDVEFLVRQLRELAQLLASDAAVTAADALEPWLGLAAGREERLVRELRQLALDIEPGVGLESLPDVVADWRSGDGLVGRVWRQYMLRVSYLALTRVLLYRAWEDVRFVDETLYDGGFDGAYERLDRNVRAVLDEAFGKGASRYRALFAADNNYVWYRPRDAALIEVLYRLAPFPLGKLDADVLGSLYVSYVDEIDRDRLGQFFTPRPVVKFMLDRAGFAAPDGLFRVEGDSRKPLRVLDFATGSGGFLVEAARRVVDDSDIPDSDAKGLHEALTAIARGFVGGEISPFPYYLTEINLLLQTSRLLGRMRLAHVDPPDFILSTMRVDSLAAKSGGDVSLEGLEPGQRVDRRELVPNDIYDVLPIEAEKLGTWKELREDGTFDLVIGNPPYVAEANNKPLFEHLRALPGWKGIYRGKTDYLYYFLWLAVEKLKPGGRLCVIVPAGWMNAGAADFLREKLAADLRLDELFLFGSYRLFADEQGPAPTPTVESAILVATKAPAPKGHKLRVVALEDESAAPAERQELLDEMVGRAAGRQGRKGGIHVHDLRQTDLRHDIPWPVKHTARDLPALVVAHLDRLLQGPSSQVELLSEAWKPFMGIQTCADSYSKKIHRNLSPHQRRLVEQSGGKVGDPVYALPAGTERKTPWQSHASVLVKSPEPEGILYGAVDDDDYVNLVRLTASDTPAASVLAAVERWKPILQARAEIARNPRRSWWETGWPRDSEDLHAPKVIALHRASRGRFALDEEGKWSPSGRMCVLVAKDREGPVAYLCGLLNSELLDLWYARRGRTPRDIWRDYEPKPLRRMPYRPPNGDPRADEVAELVRKLAANRRALLPHRGVVRDLGRVVKDPWKSGPVEIVGSALVAELPASRRVSARIDPALEVTIGERPLGRCRRESERVLAFRRGRAETGRVEGDPGRLDLLERIVGAAQIDDIAGLELPKDLAELNDLVTARHVAVSALLEEGRSLVEQIERLVCALYDVPAELTDAVVAHAVARAGTSQPDDV